MEVNKPTENKTEFAKNFCKLVEQHQVNDGDPITIGSALKELPKQAFAHGRIYDVVDVRASGNFYKATGYEATLEHGASVFVRDLSYNRSSTYASLSMQRHNGEVVTAANAFKHFPEDYAAEDVNAKSLHVPFFTGVNITKQGDEEAPIEDLSFPDFPITGRKTKLVFVLEPMYPVDSDVIEDL